MDMAKASLSRRGFLAGSGLVVSFSMLGGRGLAQTAPKSAKAPHVGDLKKYPYLDSWIGIDEAGAVTVYSGKAELGQGIETAFMQCAAEQLAVEPHSITMLMASTTRMLNEGYTAGSDSMMASATAIFQAAAQVRGILLAWAASDLGAEVTQLKVQNGVVFAPNGQSRGYGELVKGRSLHVQATGQPNLIPPHQYKIVGKNTPRLDIPRKLTGAPVYVQDMRLDGMVHARVVRPPNYGATLTSLDTSGVEKMPGVIKVVHQNNYLAVIAAGEYQAVVAMRALQQAARWQAPKRLPDKDRLLPLLKSMKADTKVLDNRGSGAITGGDILSAAYTRPYMMHGSIGPSCAVGLFDGQHVTVWTHTQGVYPLRDAIADMLSMPPEQVDCIYVEGSGCYGHNGADDVGADAAIIAAALPNRPVRVQWMREDEHGWEPYGSPMIAEMRGTLDGNGMINGWDYELWSMTFNARPGGRAANLMPAWYLPAQFGPPQGGDIPLPSGGGDRNAVPTYTLPNTNIVYHYIEAMPLRVSALRSLGGYMNVFAIESFMDELALAAKADPVAFRLKHLPDQRSRDVVQKAAETFGWAAAKTLPPCHGRGFGFVVYETIKAYCAVAVEVAVERRHRANPHGARRRRHRQRQRR